MKLNLGDYRIESDSNCFTLLAKKIVQPIVKNGEITNKDSVGNERWATVGYFTNIDKLLEAIPRQVLLDNDEMGKVIEKLSVIKIQIKELRKAMEEIKNGN